MRCAASILILVLLHVAATAQAQRFFAPKNYPAGAFIWPLDTAISLVGNFGECRPNHFHSGIDIRTYGRENFRIRSIGDGFVSRIKIEPGGFGNAIYITHLNGYTSVYAHLNRFFPALEDYVRRRQYQTQSWKQDVVFSPLDFPVRKGQFIAWSGNTGSSEGPHLHLEIRDTQTEAPLNPLLFFTGLKDNKAPVLKQIALYDGRISLYEQQPRLLPVRTGKDRVCRVAGDTLSIRSDRVYLGFSADDFMEAATGTLGVFEARLFVDGAPLFAWQMDNISYDITRYMNALADYRIRAAGGAWVQLLHRLPNDMLTVYKAFRQSDGLIDLSDGKTHAVRIELLDVKGNSTRFQCWIRGSVKAPETPACTTRFAAGQPNRYKQPSFEVFLPKEALYDDFCFQYEVLPGSQAITQRYRMHSPLVPLHAAMDLSLQPRTAIPAGKEGKVAVRRLPFGKETTAKGKAAKVEQGLVKVSVKEFGDYEIVLDETPPQISSRIKNLDSLPPGGRLTFDISDETTTVAKVRAEANGQWLRLVQKGKQYTYEADEFFPKGLATLILSAEDENGNLNTQTFTIRH